MLSEEYEEELAMAEDLSNSFEFDSALDNAD